MNAARGASSAWLVLRSLLWTILLPGLVVGYLPWRFFGFGRGEFDWSSPVPLLGFVCIALGVALLAPCIVEFARAGRGTLSPVDPPSHLVVGGLYRYVRNPMYLSVTAILLGEALSIRSMALGLFWAAWFAGAHLFVIGYEEPTLRRQFGAAYDEYAKRVGRWFPTVGHRDDAR